MAKSKEAYPRIKLSLFNYMAGYSLTSLSSTSSNSTSVRIVQERRKRSDGRGSKTVYVDTSDTEPIVKVCKSHSEVDKKAAVVEEATAVTDADKHKDGDQKKPDNDKSWTTDQDATIIEMKASNSSWRDIAQKVSTSKKDVQNRFKELKPTTYSATKSNNKGYEKVADEKGSEQKGKKDIKDKPAKQATVESDDELPLLPGAFRDDFTANDATTCATKTTADDTGNAFDEPFLDDFDNLFAIHADGTTKDKGDKGGKNHKNDRNSKEKAKDTSFWDHGFDDMGVNTTTAVDTKADKDTGNRDGDATQTGKTLKSRKSRKSGSGKGGGTKEGDHQQNISSSNDQPPIDFSAYNVGPYAERLVPDQNWTQDDCQALEMLVGRYDTNKWLYIQAGFYNWTGRMVPGEIIRAKFEQDGVI